MTYIYMMHCRRQTCHSHRETPSAGRAVSRARAGTIITTLSRTMMLDHTASFNIANDILIIQMNGYADTVHLINDFSTNVFVDDSSSHPSAVAAPADVRPPSATPSIIVLYTSTSNVSHYDVLGYRYWCLKPSTPG